MWRMAKKFWDTTRGKSCVLLALAAALLSGGGVAIWMLGNDNASRTGAVVNLIYTVITGGLLLVAIGQIHLGRAEKRKWATLQACDRYDTDPEIANAVWYLRRYHPFRDSERMLPPQVSADMPMLPEANTGNTSVLSASMRYTVSVGLILNYFDSLAIGLRQDFYDEKICRDHIGGIILKWVETFEKHDEVRFYAVMQKYYVRLLDLVNQWRPEKPIPHATAAAA